MQAWSQRMRLISHLVVGVGFISQINIFMLRYIRMAAYMKVVPKLPFGNRVEPQLSNVSLDIHTIVV